MQETILFDQLDELNWEELASLRKSNVFPRYLIQTFKIYMAQRRIRELIPIVGIVAATYVIQTIYNAIPEEYRK